ncbi:DSBA oxidoreductase [Asanoa siamensis]|uniref:DSBA oxidoreductase n=1 Tax=Asanoa siamensis TaxID=926357 RepID=A0ABQ4CTM7_9ACTN|nr:DSBA oxidoreductase [Asanoa siamensis]
MARFDHRDRVEVVHRSFVMAPDLPTGDGISQREVLRRVGKVGQAAEDYIRPIERLAWRDGLQPYEVMDRDMGNTELIHEFLAFAAEHGGNTEAWRRAYRDHFGKGRTLFSLDAVVAFATDLGFDAGEVRVALTDRRYRDRVRADHQTALRLGARGVPFTVVDERYGLSGAQEIDTYLRVITQAWDESPRVTLAGAPDADVCAETCTTDRRAPRP